MMVIAGVSLRVIGVMTGWKVDVIRVAGRHAFPAPGIEQMLTEIERGCGGGEDA